MITLTIADEDAIMIWAALAALADTFKDAKSERHVQLKTTANALRHKIIEAQDAAFKARIDAKVSQ